MPVSTPLRRRCSQPRQRVVSWVLYALVAAVASGCQSFKSLAECARVLGTANSIIEQIGSLHSAPPTSQNYRQIAELYEELELRLSEANIASPELDRAAKRYAKHLNRVERETRNYSEALSELERAISADASDEQTRAQLGLERIRNRALKLADTTKNESRRFGDLCRPTK